MNLHHNHNHGARLLVLPNNERKNMKIKRVNIPYDQVGLVYRGGRFDRLIGPGVTWLFGLTQKISVERADLQDAWMRSSRLLQLSRMEELRDYARFVDLKDGQRGILKVDGRLAGILVPGLYGFWTKVREVEIEIIDLDEPLIDRPDARILSSVAGAIGEIEQVLVPEGQVGVAYRKGAFYRLLSAGPNYFWKGADPVTVLPLSLREEVMELTGQDILTKDKITLRLNAVISYRIINPQKAVEVAKDAGQALYREAQLILREAIGGKTLEALLEEKDALAGGASERLAAKAERFGVEVQNLGIRDLILPGDMKQLLNQVLEAQKSSEANAIKRREETAAMRSQLNTAKLMESNPVLMRLRELEVLETVAQTTNLSVVLGEQKLSERITKLI